MLRRAVISMPMVPYITHNRLYHSFTGVKGSERDSQFFTSLPTNMESLYTLADDIDYIKENIHGCHINSVKQESRIKDLEHDLNTTLNLVEKLENRISYLEIKLSCTNDIESNNDAYKKFTL